jgi:hypothetical protein
LTNAIFAPAYAHVNATITVPFSTEKLRVMTKQQCRGDVSIEMLAHNPQLLPPQFVFDVGFTTMEDHDKLLVALRMLEKEAALVQQRALASKQRN